jgi:hypothetical protein
LSDHPYHPKHQHLFYTDDKFLEGEHMKSRSFSQRGQALILIALAGIALFGIAGLAIDGSAKFSDRRHAQNAADTAALAGALTLARNGTASACSTASGYSNSSDCLDIIYAAWDRADQNGYDGTLNNDVEVYSPPLNGTFSDCSDVHFDCEDYIQVIITSHIDTWFMRVLGFQQTTNVVQAVASKISQVDNFNFGGNAVVALAPDGCALMSQGGTALHVIGGGLYSNSDDGSCSFKKDSCAGVTDIDMSDDGDVDDTDDPPGTITTVGNMSVNTGCPPDANLAPAGSKQLPFPPPFEELPPPLECSKPQSYPNDKVVVLTPGYYADMPPKTNMTEVTLKPGIYCIGNDMKIKAGVKLRVEGAPTSFVTGPGVLFYFMPGGSFDFSGSSEVQIWGINQANVTLKSTDEPYKGFLIYAAPDYSTGTPVGCTINGSSTSMFQSTIFAPFCNITMNGGSGETGFQSQLIGYNVKFSGTSDIYLNYNANASPTWNIPLQVGLSR